MVQEIPSSLSRKRQHGMQVLRRIEQKTNDRIPCVLLQSIFLFIEFCDGSKYSSGSLYVV